MPPVMRLGPALLEQMRQLDLHARSHVYQMGHPGALRPGHCPGHFLETDFAYQIVYSWTALAGKMFRVLSLWTPWHDRKIALAFADALGFEGLNDDSGLPADCRFQSFPHEHRMVLSQPIAAYCCPSCSAISFNPNDLSHRYCGACNSFADPATAAEGSVDSPAWAEIVQAHDRKATS